MGELRHMEGGERVLGLGEAPHFCNSEEEQSFLVPGEYLKRCSARFLNLYFVWASTALPTSQPYVGERRLVGRGSADPFTSPGCLGLKGLWGISQSLSTANADGILNQATVTISVSLHLSAPNLHTVPVSGTNTLPHAATLQTTPFLSGLSIYSLRALDHVPLRAARGTGWAPAESHTPQSTAVDEL